MPDQQTGTAETDDIRDVLTDASRTQFAAFAAAVTFWSTWAESAASYARSMSEELAKISVEIPTPARRLYA